MIYFDTNVIVYSVVNQDVGKKVLARDKIFTAKKLNQFQLSPLLLQELVFSLAKLKMTGEALGRIFKSYKIYSDYNIE